MGLLYGRAGRLTAENGGFRRGQWQTIDAVVDGITGSHPMLRERGSTESGKLFPAEVRQTELTFSTTIQPT